MTASLVLPTFVLWATLMRALLVAAKLLPPSCRQCGMLLERRELGEAICQCSR
jgi:hypothetical protein